MAFLLLLLSGAVQAELRVGGFATLGMTTSNNDELIFRTSLNRWPESGTNYQTESLVGLQFNYQFNDDIDVVVQGVLENEEYDSVLDYIELAFARYQLNRRVSLRLGRMNYNAYILSEYLDVGYSYLWATPPAEFYTPSSYLSYLDGGEVQYRNSLSEGVIQATIALGHSEAEFLNIGSISNLHFKYMINASVSYETEHLLLKGALSYFKGQEVDIDDLDRLITVLYEIPEAVWPDAADIAASLEFEDKTIRYAGIGLRYNNNNWIVMSELAYFDVNWGLLGDLGYGYLSLGYEFDEITPYFTIARLDSMYDRYEVGQPRYDLVAGPVAQQGLAFLSGAIQQLYDASRMDQHSYAIGVRWDFRPNWALKAQFTRYQVNGPGYGVWGSELNVTVPDHRHVNVLSINLNTVF